MVKKQKLFIGLMAICFMMAVCSCATVKPYEKAYVNDEDMKLAPRSEETFEFNSETYREGASGGAGSKAGGGCGCY